MLHKPFRLNFNPLLLKPINYKFLFLEFDLFKSSVLFSGCVLWNTLPPTLRSIKSTIVFKKQLFNSLQNTYQICCAIHNAICTTHCSRFTLQEKSVLFVSLFGRLLFFYIFFYFAFIFLFFFCGLNVCYCSYIWLLVSSLSSSPLRLH